MDGLFSPPPAAGSSADAPATVSQFLARAKGALEDNMDGTWVTGEVANFTRAASGHWYFSLRDDDGGLDCVMLSRQNRQAEGVPATGDKVLVFGNATLYTPRGRFQMAVRELQFAGAGRLHQLFLKRKAEWHARGWFANVRPLPPFPRTLGVVCSTSGAALQDVLRTLKKRTSALRVVIYPAPAQGEGAAEKIAAMVDAASARRECEVLLLVRGGGSLEDLWAYNEEAVVTAVHQCAIPVVSGIGHEIDNTLADYAADLRCATPTAAAAAAVPDAAELLERIAAAEKFLHRRTQARLDDGAQRLDWAQRLLGEPQRLLAHKGAQLNALRQALISAAQLGARQAALDGKAQAFALFSPQRLLARKQEQWRAARQALIAAAQLTKWQTALERQTQALTLLSPQHLLQRGYAIVTDAGGAVVRTVQHARGERKLNVRLSDGEVEVKPLNSIQ